MPFANREVIIFLVILINLTHNAAIMSNTAIIIINLNRAMREKGSNS